MAQKADMKIKKLLCLVLKIYIKLNKLLNAFNRGPSTINPLTKQPYATTFPLLTVHDMIKIQFKLLDHLKIKNVNLINFLLQWNFFL